jgi:hypothetical protein
MIKVKHRYTMTPQEKAKELINRYYSITGPFTEAKQCALIAIEEIINNNSKIPGLLTQDTMHNTSYWQEVMDEIKTYNTNTP